MQLRLISWFFIALNFMEYIGSQHASRVRRQGRSKCEGLSALLSPLPAPCRPPARELPRCSRAPRRADLRAFRGVRRDGARFGSFLFSLSPHRDEQRRLRDELRVILSVC